MQIKWVSYSSVASTCLYARLQNAIVLPTQMTCYTSNNEHIHIFSHSNSGIQNLDGKRLAQAAHLLATSCPWPDNVWLILQVSKTCCLRSTTSHLFTRTLWEDTCCRSYGPQTMRWSLLEDGCVWRGAGDCWLLWDYWTAISRVDKLFYYCTQSNLE
jgi:hypothetical protein